jgi:opacity protein-like surface antigen
MRKLLLGSVALVVLASVSQAMAADMPSPAFFTWTGLHFGFEIGSEVASTKIADPFGPSIFGDTVTSPGALGGLNAGFDWQVPNSNLVLGVEADANLIDSVGNNTCYAVIRSDAR